MLQYRTLRADEICRALFASFIRRQNVTKCWRKENDAWVIKDAPFIDDWSERDYQTLIACLKHTVEAGGFVYAAFCDGLLKALFPLSPSCLAARNNTLICQAFMFPRINAARASAKRCFWRLGHGPERRERGSCTSPRIPLLKARRFTGPWAVLRRGYTIKRMLRRSPMIASWNAACK